jgi:hypothetical protein
MNLKLGSLIGFLKNLDGKLLKENIGRILQIKLVLDQY